MPRIDGFLPSTSGFHFPNSFPHVPLRTVHVPELAVEIPILDAANGLCGGMVYAVRDYFEHGMPPPALTAPPSDGPLFDYLVQRLFESWDLPGGVLRYLYLMNPELPDVDSPLTRLDPFAHARARVMIEEEWPPPDSPSHTIESDFEAHGLRCLVIQVGMPGLEEVKINIPSIQTKWRNGYVLVPEDHPCADMDDDQLYKSYDVDVHGGLTFCQKDSSGGMWFGFDTNHYGDTNAKLTDISSLLIFFELELNRIEDEPLEEHMKVKALAHYRPWLENLRKEKPYQLEDKLEELFLEKSQTGFSAWNRVG